MAGAAPALESAIGIVVVDTRNIQLKDGNKMKAQTVNLIWGLILILAGGLFLAQNLGYIEQLSPQWWLAIFSALSLLFLTSYFLSGVQNWGWLFPASIFAGVALTLSMALSGIDNAAVGAPVIASVGIPFVVAYLLQPRQNWWALIPAWVMEVLTLIIFIAERAAGEVIGALFLFAIALPFLLVYLVNRSRRWALIPAFVLATIGLIPLLTLRASGELIGAFVTFAIALPFVIVYFWSPGNWWALIPAGVMGSISLGLLIFAGSGFNANIAVLGNGVLFLGWAATFGILWLRRDVHPTAWAKYPAVILTLIGVMALVFGAGFQNYWPAALIVLGGWLIYANLRAKKSL
jgi:hypothetical protein